MSEKDETVRWSPTMSKTRLDRVSDRLEDAARDGQGITPDKLDTVTLYSWVDLLRGEVDALITENGRLHKQLYAASRLLSKARDIMSYDSADPMLQNAIDIWLVDYTPEKHIQGEADDE